MPKKISLNSEIREENKPDPIKILARGAKEQGETRLH